MLGSRMICGLVLHKGDLSWLSKSISSLVICLIDGPIHGVSSWQLFIIIDIIIIDIIIIDIDIVIDIIDDVICCLRGGLLGG